MPRKKLAATIQLKVVFEPDDGGWHVYVPAIQGCRTWGRSLSEARRRIREALSLFEEDFDGNADRVAREAVFDEDIRLPATARAAVKRYERALERATTANRDLKAAQNGVARALTDTAGVSLRDAGELLGLSQEGVRKILKAG